MKNLNLDYGNSKISFSLPNSSVVVEYGKTYEDPPIVDTISKTKEALNKPLNFSTLKDALADPTIIAFFIDSQSIISEVDNYPTIRPAKVSPAPVGSNTSSNSKAGA